MRFKDFESVYLQRVHNVGAGGVDEKGGVQFMSFKRFRQANIRTARAIGNPIGYMK